MDALEIPAEQISVPPPLQIRIVRDGILAFLGVVVLAIALAIVAILAARVMGAIPPELNTRFLATPGWTVGLLLTVEVPFFGFAIYLRRRYRSQGHVLPKLFEGDSVSSISKGIVTGLGLVVVGVICVLLAVKLFGNASTSSRDEINQTLFAMKSHPLALSALVLTIAVVAPVCEEFFFRGALFGSVRSTPQARAGAIVSSVLFAIAHLNPMLIFYYLIVGLTTCRLLSKTNTLAAPIAAHLTINSLVCLAVLTARS